MIYIAKLFMSQKDLKERFNRNDFAKSKGFLILRFKSQAPHPKQRLSPVRIFVIRQKWKEGLF